MSEIQMQDTTNLSSPFLGEGKSHAGTTERSNTEIRKDHETRIPFSVPRDWVLIGSGIQQDIEGLDEDFQIWWTPRSIVKVFQTGTVVDTTLKDCIGNIYPTEKIIKNWKSTFLEEQRASIELVSQVIASIREASTN